MRKAAPGHQYFSIERLFEDVASNLPEDMRGRIHRCRFFGRGVLRRVLIALEASLARGDVTHVTGDIHFATIIGRRRTTVLTIHDLLVYQRCSGLKRWIYRKIWLDLSIDRAQVVTVVSEATRADLLASCRVSPSKVRVVHNCVSPAFVHSPKPFREGCPRLLQVGTKPNKNLERLIDALTGIKCHLRIIGATTARQRELLLDRGIEHSEVAAIDDPQMVDEYRQADIVVFMSLSEGFGLPIVEAQATGRVVVTSNHAPMTEVAGEGAIYANPADPASIRAAVESAIRDPRRREAAIAAGTRNVKRFSAKEIADRYASIYRELGSR
jgi:glycosyltransferase involved in cell wall biosynthesis